MKRSMSHINIRQISVVTALLFSLCLPLRAYAAAGDLDPTFGNGGKVTTDFGGSDVANALAIQSDGKIVVAGNTSDLSLVLARYNVNGSLDTTFGTGGSIVTGLLRGSDVVIQPDGKIVVAGNSFSPQTDIDFAVARFTSNGGLDTSFGIGGIVTTDFSGEADQAFAVALQSNGKIVAVGRAFNFNNGTFVDFALARYNSDGSLDAGFGSGGKVTTHFGFRDNEQALDVAIQPDGKIIAAGTVVISATFSDFALARYNSNGSLDTGFGSGGKVTTDFFFDDDVANGLALQSDGRIVAAGFAANPNTFSFDFALARYNSDGSLDTGFGSGGKVTTDFFSDFDSIDAIAIQVNGKIIAAGSARVGLATQADFALARYNNDGSLDAGFGSGGKVTTDFFNSIDLAHDVALQPDGKIVAVGSANTSAANTDFAVARYLGDEVAAFDLCLQDDNNRSLLRFSSTTGEYQFINCGSLSFAGTGNVQIHGCTVVLRDSRPDRRVLVQLNTCAMRGTASIQVLSPQRARFSILDRDTTNNTCSCQ
jgi:uncharacterized delta-60 repeat protein